MKQADRTALLREAFAFLRSKGVNEPKTANLCASFHAYQLKKLKPSCTGDRCWECETWIKSWGGCSECSQFNLNQK
jgi:hypothetical protein